MSTNLYGKLRLRSALCVLIIMALFISSFIQSVIPVHAADTVTINLASQLGAPTYRASGFLYGLSQDGTQPPQTMQSNIKTRFIRAGGSQIGCPNGGWVNGQYAVRWNSTRAYYTRARAIGARLILLPSDMWGADAVCTVPRWPGDNGNWTEYTNFLNQVINDVIANGMTGSDVQWDIWNEPELSIFWGRSQSQYLETWRRAYQQIRSRIPNAVIVGPSMAGQPSSGNTWFITWLNFVQANSVVPNYISWHQLVTSSDPQTSKTNLDNLLSARGISVQGYQVNEYGANSNGEQQPGPSVWYIGRFERNNIDALRANWGLAGGLYSGMGGLVTSSGQAMGVWWAYKRYADITGQRVSLTAGSMVDGVAGTDSNARRAILVLGTRSTPNTTTVQINGFGSAAYLLNNGQVNVLVERMPNGSGAVSAPPVVSNTMMTVTNNSLTVTINWTNRLDAYAITLTPPTTGVITVDDSVQGTGQNQFNYNGSGWRHGSGGASNATTYNNTNSWNNTANQFVTVAFTGTQIRFYGVKDPGHGIGAVSIDGGSETNIDFFASPRAGNQLMWTSPTLPRGSHTFRLRVTGTRNASSSNTWVAPDRVDIIP